MIKLTKFFVGAVLCLIVTKTSAQDSLQVSGKQAEIARYESYKTQVEIKEKDALKLEIEAINEQLESNTITASEAEKMKMQAAEKRALNIKNKDIVTTLRRIKNFNAYVVKKTSSSSILEFRFIETSLTPVISQL